MLEISTQNPTPENRRGGSRIVEWLQKNWRTLTLAGLAVPVLSACTSPDTPFPIVAAEADALEAGADAIKAGAEVGGAAANVVQAGANAADTLTDAGGATLGTANKVITEGLAPPIIVAGQAAAQLIAIPRNAAEQVKDSVEGIIKPQLDAAAAASSAEAAVPDTAMSEQLKAFEEAHPEIAALYYPSMQTLPLFLGDPANGQKALRIAALNGHINAFIDGTAVDTSTGTEVPITSRTQLEAQIQDSLRALYESYGYSDTALIELAIDAVVDAAQTAHNQTTIPSGRSGGISSIFGGLLPTVTPTPTPGY